MALPQSAFTPRPPKPIEDLVPEMDEQGRALLLVGEAKQMIPSDNGSHSLTRFLVFPVSAAIPRLQPLPENIGLRCFESPLLPKRGQSQPKRVRHPASPQQQAHYRGEDRLMKGLSLQSFQQGFLVASPALVGLQHQIQ